MQKPSVTAWRLRQRLNKRGGILTRRFFGVAVVAAIFGEFTRRLLTLPAETSSVPLSLRITVVILAAALVGFAIVSRISTIQRGRLVARRLHAIRDLEQSLDVFRRKAREAEAEDQIQDAFESFIRGALVAIDEYLFADLDVAITLMRESGGYLRIIAYYPQEMSIRPEWTLSVNGKKGYALLAYREGTSVYVPYVDKDWGVFVRPGNAAGDRVRFGSEVHSGLWAESGRRDYGSVLTTPTLVVTSLARYRALRYGVLNIESQRANAMKSDHFYCSCVAASLLAQAMEIDAKMRVALLKPSDDENPDTTE